MRRYWINQPSTQQPHHNLHGENVLCDLNDPSYLGRPVVQAWFTHGDAWSADILRNSLSEGWRNTKPPSFSRKLKPETEFLYVRSMSKAHRVTAIFTDDDSANARMAATTEVVIAEFKPFIFLAEQYGQAYSVSDRDKPSRHAVDGYQHGSSTGLLVTLDDGTRWFHPYSGGKPIKL